MEDWAKRETRAADFGDKRLTRRAGMTVETLGKNPGASIPEACETTAEKKAVYRFTSNEKVTGEKILEPHSEETAKRIAEQGRVLVIQDTTELNFTQHKQTSGLGPLDYPVCQGLKVHTCFAVSVDGVPLGTIDQLVWARDSKAVGKKHQRSKRETKDKESQRWIDGQQKSQARIPPSVPMVTVADREADIYDLFAAPRRENAHLLVRLAHNRNVKHEENLVPLRDAMERAEVRGEMMVEVGRARERHPRTARLTVKYERMEIQPPVARSKSERLLPMVVWVVEVKETNPPAGQHGIIWLLLTTMPVTTSHEAEEKVRWYSQRWLIERFHYTLKSGCGVEELQLETAERLCAALALYTIVAWHLLYMLYMARRSPDAPCTLFLTTEQWKALYCVVMKSRRLPPSPPTVREAVIMIAKMGGFWGRKADGDPGIKTLWRGWCKFSQSFEMHQTLMALQDVGNG